MLIVTISLVGVGGKLDELERMEIVNNESGIDGLANYAVRVRGTNIGTASVLNFPRNRIHVWHLVARALERLGYGAW